MEMNEWIVDFFLLNQYNRVLVLIFFFILHMVFVYLFTSTLFENVEFACWIVFWVLISILCAKSQVRFTGHVSNRFRTILKEYLRLTQLVFSHVQ